MARLRDLTDNDDGDGDGDGESWPDHGPDPRRDLRVSAGLDGLHHLEATLEPVAAEQLLTLLDAVEQPGWHVEPDPDTATCHWTGPAGQQRRTHPPPP